MSGNDQVPSEMHDDSPWRPGADVRFEYPPRRSFPRRDDVDDRADRVGGRPVGVAAHEDDRLTRAPASPPVAFAATGRRRRQLAGGIAMGLAIAGSAVVLQGGTPSPAGSVAPSAATVAIDDVAGSGASALQDLGGDVVLGAGDLPLLTALECPAQRVPSAIDPLWDAAVADARRIVSPASITDDSVVAVVASDEIAANSLRSVSLVALHIDDGQERWRASLQPATGAHEIVGIVERAVIVRSAAGPDMAYRRLFAFDEDSGEVLWDRGFRGDWAATVDASSRRVYVGVRRPAVSTTGVTEVVVLDARTGRREHIAAGAFVGLDSDAKLVTRIGDEVLATSPTDRDVLGVVVPSDAPFAVVGPRVVVADGEDSEFAVYSGSGRERRFPVVGSSGIAAPGQVAFLESLGESALLVSSEGSVHGAQIGEGTVELRWRLNGAMLGSAASDRGRSLVIATEGGAQQRVVDSSTGRTIVNLQLRPGALTTLGLVANGVVMLDVVDGSSVRTAVDLDGRALWSLPGDGPLAVGREIVVDIVDPDELPDGSVADVRLAAYGDSSDAGSGAAGCRSAMTEWVPR